MNFQFSQGRRLGANRRSSYAASNTGASMPEGAEWYAWDTSFVQQTLMEHRSQCIDNRAAIVFLHCSLAGVDDHPTTKAS